MNSEECRTTSSDKLNSNQPQLEGFKRLLVEFDWLPFWLANPHPKASRWSGKESSGKETSVVGRLVGSSQRSPPSLQIIRSDQAVKLVRAQADARTTAAARLAAVEALLPSSGIKLAFCAARWRVRRQSHAGDENPVDQKGKSCLRLQQH